MAPNQASTDAGRAGYLSSVFVRIGRAEFSFRSEDPCQATPEENPRGRSKSSERELSFRKTSRGSGAMASRASFSSLSSPQSMAVLSGLTFKGQFLRLVLWEAQGNSVNPGRQVGGVAR